MSEFYGYENGYKDKVLLSQTYTWAKGKYKFEIILIWKIWEQKKTILKTVD